MGPGPAKNSVPGLIGPLTAPNGILKAYPNRNLRGRIDSGAGFAPEARKRSEMSGCPGRAGLDFRKKSGFFPEWSGMAWEGLGTITSGVRGSKKSKHCLGLGQWIRTLLFGLPFGPNLGVGPSALGTCKHLS